MVKEKIENLPIYAHYTHILTMEFLNRIKCRND
jgi:hypothetical protein